MAGKYWIVYASCGRGHFSPALSLRSLLKDTPTVINILNYNKIFKLFYDGGYRFITNKFSYVWTFIFRISQLPSPAIDRLRRIIESVLLRGFIRDLSEKSPSKLIITHFLPLDIINVRRIPRGMKVWCFITDFDIHRFWVSPVVDRYFVATPFTKERLLKFGVSSRRITVSGIPIRGGFLDIQSPGGDYNLTLRLLVFTNIFKSGELKAFVNYVNDSGLGGYFLCTDREIHLKILEQHLKNRNFKVFVFRWDIFNIIKNVDIVITKPGGSILSELLYLRKNFILYDVLGGQERRNLDVIINSGLGFAVRGLPGMIGVLKEIDKNRDILRIQQEHMKDFYVYRVSEVLRNLRYDS